MKKNIIIIILLGIIVAFGILLGNLTLNSKCNVDTKKVSTKKEKKEEVKTYEGYYKGSIQNENDPDNPHEIYIALHENNSVVITYIYDEKSEYIGGYKVNDNEINLTTEYTRGTQSSGRYEETHKLKISDQGSIVYETEESESYKTEFNNLPLLEITKEEYESTLNNIMAAEDY